MDMDQGPRANLTLTGEEEKDFQTMGGLDAPLAKTGINLVRERLSLWRAGWAYKDDKMADFLACMISRRQPANANTLDQAIKILIDTGRAATREEALDLLKNEETLHKALRIGISLWHSGLDLEDWATVNLFNFLLRDPTALEICKSLVNLGEKDLKRVRGLVDKAIKANG